MIGWLLSRPPVLAAIAAALLAATLALGALSVRLAVQLHGARSDLSAEIVAHSHTKDALTDVEANRDELAGDLAEQTKAVEAFAGQCKGEAIAADARALRAIAEVQRRRAEVRATPGAGPDQLNAWLRAAFEVTP